MKSALIGYSGFVGSNLTRQYQFHDLYRSTNIADIRRQSYDLIVCAGAPAQKWIANKQPESDIANLQGLMEHLQYVKANTFVLISTIDVYPQPVNGDEDCQIDISDLDPYGKHRYQLELFVREQFGSSTHVMRLPGLFGDGLKKNFIYDLLNNNALDYTHCDSKFQFYDVSDLWQHIQVMLKYNITLLNMATEPVPTWQIAKRCFNIDFTNVTDRSPSNYDMRTKYAQLFGKPDSNYIYSSDEIYTRISGFISRYRAQII